MNGITEKFQDFADGLSPDFIGACSLQALLYSCYAEDNPLEDDAIREDFKHLETELHTLSLSDNNRLFYIITSLCEKYAQNGFHAGFEIGFKFAGEIAPLLQQE